MKKMCNNDLNSIKVVICVCMCDVADLYCSNTVHDIQPMLLICITCLTVSFMWLHQINLRAMWKNKSIFNSVRDPFIWFTFKVKYFIKKVHNFYDNFFACKANNLLSFFFSTPNIIVDGNYGGGDDDDQLKVSTRITSFVQQRVNILLFEKFSMENR